MKKAGFFISILCVLYSCGSSKQGEKDDTPVINADSLIEMNRKLVQADVGKIEEYIEVNDLDMERSGTGMFFNIIRDAGKDKALSGNQVSFSYRIKDLSGNMIYSSETLGSKSFEIDKSNIESGWNEAAKLMGPGDSAVIILPPHLAFRNIGDNNKIGPGQVLIYELRLDSAVKGE